MSWPGALSKAQRIAVDIAASDSAVQRHAFIGRWRRGIGCRRVVDRKQGQGLRGWDRAALAVADGIGDRHRAVIVGVRREGEGRVAVVMHSTVVGADADRDQRRQVAVRVDVALRQCGTGQDIIMVFVAGRQAVRRPGVDRCVIDRIDREALAGRRRAAVAVADRVAERHGAVVIGRRSNGEGAVAVIVDRAVISRKARDRQSVAIDVAEALQQVGSRDDIPGIFGAVGQSRLEARQGWRVIDRIDDIALAGRNRAGDGNGGGDRRAAVTVRD